MKYPEISRNPAIQREYERMREDGQSHNCAEMFAFQTAPGVDTDATFMRGKKLGGEQFDGSTAEQEYGRRAIAAAEKAGVSVTGKYYSTALAEKPLDPGAWISDKHDIKKRCEATGMSCEGAVRVQGQMYAKDE